MPLKLAFKKGDTVAVADLATDTGIVDGVSVASMSGPGEVVEVRRHPPHVPLDHRHEDDSNESPHYLVRLAGAGDATHEVWFAEPRLSRS